MLSGNTVSRAVDCWEKVEPFGLKIVRRLMHVDIDVQEVILFDVQPPQLLEGWEVWSCLLKPPTDTLAAKFCSL